MTVIAMAEDNPAHERAAVSLLERFFEEQGETCEVIRCHDGREVVGLAGGRVDAFLLDIEMPDVDGLHAAKAIRERDPDVPICFLTSYGQLAPAGYEVDAVGFLVKPLRYASLCVTMRRVCARIRARRPNLFAYKDGRRTSWADVRDVAYMESVDKKVVIHMSGGQRLACSESLRSLEARLSSEGMFRVHSAFLVNLGFVREFSRAEVVVAGDRIPVSKHRKQAFAQALADYLGRGA